MASSDRLLVLRTTNAKVAVGDERFLESRYDVRAFRVVLYPKIKMGLNLLRMVVWLAWHMPTAKGVFFRFADYYAVLPVFFARLFRRKSYIVLGGYDAHCFPEYQYGVFCRPFRAWCVRYAIRNAAFVLPVDETLYDGLNTYTFDHPVKTGIKTLVPRINGAIVTIYDGWDSQFWTPAIGQRAGVMMVASVPCGTSLESRTRMAELKGLHTLISIARKMPTVNFTVVGPCQEDFPFEIPANVTLTGWIAPEEVRAHYRRAAVCVHPSLTESRPAAVAEAMLCECVPVGSSVNGIPDLIGQTGIVVATQNADDWVSAVKSALAMDTGHAARLRVMSKHSPQARFDKLWDILP